MTESIPAVDLTNHFLISMPHMSDSNFTHTLTYICDHNDQGAMGIVVNRPMDMSLKEILEHLEIDSSKTAQPEQQIYNGGPVAAERGFIVHSPTGQQWASTHRVTDQVSLSTSLDILESIGAGQGPERFLVALGYAGWGAGQLEQELADNTWLSCPADLNILFNANADERLQQAAASLGVDLGLLTSQSGHA